MSNIFKRIIEREAHADIVYETEHVLAFKDLDPKAPVHILIIPKQEISGLAAVPETGDHMHILNAARAIAEQEGLTGGYLPLAATLTTERVYEGFLGEFSEFKTFFHGHTYTGNPLACAAAIATLDVFEEERTLDRLRPKIELLWRTLEDVIAPLPAVAEVRGRGFMVGIELTEHPLEARIGHQVTLAARRRGAIIRPLGDTIVLMPPLAIEPAELRRLVEITAGAIAEATGAARLPLAA